MAFTKMAGESQLCTKSGLTYGTPTETNFHKAVKIILQKNTNIRRKALNFCKPFKNSGILRLLQILQDSRCCYRLKKLQDVLFFLYFLYFFAYLK
jgi:hypothetical protein